MADCGSCPLCHRRYPNRFLLIHAASCLGSDEACPQHSEKGIKQSISVTSAVCLPRATSTSHLLKQCGAPGFYVFEEFVSLEFESQLLELINSTPPEWKDLRVRQSKNYGPPFSLEHRRLLFEKDGYRPTPLPGFASDLIMPMIREKVPKSIYPGQSSPNQLVIAKYDGHAETHILPHSDCENDVIHDPILGLSLSGSAIMTLLLPRARSGLGRTVKKDVHLPRRSLYVMSGPALYSWHHGIFPGKTNGTRYSLTFRRASPGTNVTRTYPRKSYKPSAAITKSTRHLRQTRLK